MISIMWTDPSMPEANNGIATWVCQQVFGPGSPNRYLEHVCMGVFEDGELIGAVIFHGKNAAANVAEMSAAATTAKWINRQTLRELFSFPFEEEGLQMLVARTSEKNERMNRQFKALGFDQYRIPRLRGRNEDEIVWTMTDDQYRESRILRRING